MPSPEVLRSTINPLLRHTRLCTVTQLDIANEVVPSKILNEKELLQILVSISAKVEFTELGEVCSNIKKREIKINFIKRYCTTTSGVSPSLSATTFQILVKKKNVEIVSVEFASNHAAWDPPFPEGLTYQCDGKITIDKVNYSNNASYDLMHAIPFSKTVKYNKWSKLQLTTSNYANVVLDANNKYRITVEFTNPHRAYQHDTSNPAWDKKDFDLSKFTVLDDDSCPVMDARSRPTKYVHHFTSLEYRVQD